MNYFFPGILTVNLLLNSGRIHSIQEPTSLKTIFLRSGENVSKDFMREQGQTMLSNQEDFWRREFTSAEAYLRHEVKKQKQDQTRSL